MAKAYTRGQKLKTWWRQKRCRHLKRRSVITAVMLEYPRLEAETTCIECGAHCDPDYLFSNEWVFEKMDYARTLPTGSRVVIFDSRPEGK